MSSSEQKHPIVEPSPVVQPSVTERALNLRIRQQEILAELGVIALRGTPLPELLEHAVRLIAEGLEAEFCKILEYLPSEKHLLLRAGVGWNPGLIGVATVGADAESPSGYALRTGKPVVSNQLDNEQRFRTPELLAQHAVRRAINVIVQGHGVPFGVLEVDSTSQGDFSEKDIAFLQGAANIVGMALERQRQERSLTAALDHHRVLLKEIHHRVKNSLQLVMSMLSLTASAYPDANVRHVLGDAGTRVVAIARAHDRLYRQTEISQIELGPYLADVCRDLEDAIPNCSVSFQATDPAAIATDRAIHLALIVTELVTNAAKHAYRTQGGTISVTLARSSPSTVTVSIADRGIGVPVDFDLERAQGLGMQLVRVLIDQMGGTLHIERGTPGATFVIDAPLDGNFAGIDLR